MKCTSARRAIDDPTDAVTAADPLYDPVSKPSPNEREFRLEPSATPEIVLFDNLLLAILPANIALVTVPESPVVINVPDVAGSVIWVAPPATAAGVSVIVPDVAPGIAIDRMPPRD